MKKKLFDRLLLLICSLLVFSSCSNDAVDQDNDNLSNILSEEVKPYISPGMQSIINTCSSHQKDSVDVFELIPSLKETFFKEVLSISKENMSLLKSGATDGINVFIGYTTKTFLFSTTITIPSNVVSSLGQSFQMGSYCGDKKLYLRCWAITKSFYFSSSTLVDKVCISGDKIGYDPDFFNPNLTTNTYLPRGYHMDEKLAGRYYIGTTYMFDYGVNPSSYLGIFPTFTSLDLDQSITALQWRMYAITL